MVLSDIVVSSILTYEADSALLDFEEDDRKHDDNE